MSSSAEPGARPGDTAQAAGAGPMYELSGTSRTYMRVADRGDRTVRRT